MSQFTARNIGNARGPDSALVALRFTSVLACLTVLYLAATAGEILMNDDGAGNLHAVGAIALYVLTGLTAVAAFVHRRVAEAPWWPTMVAVGVFGASFLQGLVGQRSTLYVHVPLALGLMIGSTVVATWALTARWSAATR